jgi:hypothetical protein
VLDGLPAGRAAREVAVGALVAKLGRRVGQRAERGEREGAPDRHPADAGLGELGDRRGTGDGEHVHRAVHRRDHLPDVREPGQARGVQHVGARRLVRLQPGDRVRQVRAPVQVVLGACGEHQAHRSRVCRLGGGRDALGRQPGVINGLGLAAGEILQRAARQPGFHGQGDGPRDAGRLVGVAVLQVGGDREPGRRDDRGGVGQGLVAAHRAVQAPQRRGEPGTRGGERLKAQRGEQPRGSLVPWVRQ